MNFKVINGVETIELSAAERRSLEKALPILGTLGRKADSDLLRKSSELGEDNIQNVLKLLDAQAVDTDA